jgi:hypothetical protein
MATVGGIISTVYLWWTLEIVGVNSPHATVD